MLTGEELWSAVLADPSGIEQSLDASVQAVHQKLYKQIPSIIAKHLALPATPSNFLRAKIAYLRWALTTPFVFEEVKAQLLADKTEMVEDKELKRLVHEEVHGGILALEKRLLHTVEDNGAELRGLSRPARVLQKAGTLTIEQLLRLQPELFIRSGRALEKTKAAN